MTTVEVQYRYVVPPSESVSQALAKVQQVYGIRHLRFDSGASTLRVEYDATRLNSTAVTKLVRDAGLGITESVPPALAQTEPKAAVAS